MYRDAAGKHECRSSKRKIFFEPMWVWKYGQYLPIDQSGNEKHIRTSGLLPKGSYTAAEGRTLSFEDPDPGDHL